MITRTIVHVFVNRRKLELDTVELTGEQLLRAVGFSGNERDLYKLQGRAT
jgi:hypothetical protein